MLPATMIGDNPGREPPAPPPRRHPTARLSRVWHGLGEIPADWGPCVVTIGVFDGVHRGHARLIQRTVRLAREHETPAVLVTFDPHPARVVGPPRDTATLSTPRRRAELARELGVDAVLVLPFTPDLARTPARDFAMQVLVHGLRAAAVVIGRNFRFGAGGAGDLATLDQLGRRHGFTAEGVDLLHTGETRCSSTYVRHCLASGDLAGAAAALGRPHRIEGLLCGDTLAVPTYTAVPPANRRYRARLTVEPGTRHPVEVLVQSPDAVRIVGSPPRTGTSWVALDFLP